MSVIIESYSSMSQKSSLSKIIEYALSVTTVKKVDKNHILCLKVLVF